MKKNIKWNVFLMLVEAKKYTCRKQFKKQSSYCYKLITRIGMIDMFLDHMPRMINKKGSWDRDSILKISIRYKSRVDFFKSEKSAYRSAQKLNILNDVCSHMERPEQHRYWTKEKIFECAKKYNKKLDFQTQNTGAYAAARKLNIVNDICAHMEFKNDYLKEDELGRTCKKCGEFKLRESMCFSSKNKSGMSSICRDCKAIYSKERLKNNPEKYNFNTANRRSMHSKATPKWLNRYHKNEMFMFYKKARNLSISTKVTHEVDHIIPIRSKVVCGLHVPWNLQVITQKQNRSKNNKIYHEL